MIASSKREGNVKDSKEDEKILRLFIVCDKSSTEEELREHFSVRPVDLCDCFSSVLFSIK